MTLPSCDATLSDHDPTPMPLTLGHHWLLDLHGCPESVLDDFQKLRACLTETTDRFRFTLLNIAGHRFEPQGVTVLGLLAESHLSIHTWPEHGYAAIDIFTCGTDAELDAACEFLAAALQARESRLMRLDRGTLSEQGPSIRDRSAP